MIIRRILIIFFGLFTSLLNGQSELNISTNKSFYTTGEKVGVVVSEMSLKGEETVYIELLSKNGDLLESRKVRSDGIIGAAIFTLPLDGRSGWYVIRAFTTWSPSFSIKDLGYQTIAVYNEFETLQASGMLPASEVNPNENASFAITTNQEDYSKGEWVEANLELFKNNLRTVDSRYIMTVLDKRSFELQKAFQDILPKVSFLKKPALSIQEQKVNSLVYVAGTNNDVSNVLGALYVKEDKRISWVSFNDKNLFGFELEDFTGTKNIQLMGLEPLGLIKQLDAEISRYSSDLEWPNVNWPSLPMNSKLAEYIELSKKRKIVRDIFNVTDTKREMNTFENINFTKADRSYAPKDFKRFNDTPDFINEVVSFLKIRKNENGPLFRVLLEKNKLGLQEPLLLLNEFITSDINELLSMDLDRIERIDIYRKEKTIANQFGNLGNSGVVAFYTKDRTERPRSNAIIPIQGYVDPTALIDTEVSEDYPSFSTVIYWNPNIPGPVGILPGFRASDDFGEYIIQIDQYTDGSVERATKSIKLIGRTNSQD